MLILKIAAVSFLLLMCSGLSLLTMLLRHPRHIETHIAISMWLAFLSFMVGILGSMTCLIQYILS